MMGNLKVTDHNSDIIRNTLKVPLPQIAHKSIVPMSCHSFVTNYAPLGRKTAEIRFCKHNQYRSPRLPTSEGKLLRHGSVAPMPDPMQSILA